MKNVFFKDKGYQSEAFSLAASSGVPFQIDKENWVLGQFIKEHA